MILRIRLVRANEVRHILKDAQFYFVEIGRDASAFLIQYCHQLLKALHFLLRIDDLDNFPEILLSERLIALSFGFDSFEILLIEKVITSEDLIRMDSFPIHIQIAMLHNSNQKQ